MGCGSCGTSKPGGCQSNGGCSTGGCNRLNVHDWLLNLPFSDPESNCKIVEVSFKQGSRKEYFRNATLQFFEKGDYVTLEGVISIYLFIPTYLNMFTTSLALPFCLSQLPPY